MNPYLTAFENGIDESGVKSFLLDESLCDEERAEVLRFFNEHLDGNLLAAFGTALRKNQAFGACLPGAMDNCGTGGSGLPRINTSTLMAFILSALGIGMAKHGNRAASGRFGSFDLLEALGIEIHQSPEHLQYLYYKTGLAFLFARDLYPIAGRLAPARKLIDGPTVINYVGPLLNPANAEFQVIGTPSVLAQDLIAHAALSMGKKVSVVRGVDGLDEISVSGDTVVFEVDPEKKAIREYTLNPQDFGLDVLPLEAVLVDSVEEKVRVAQAILSGDLSSAHSQLVMVNAAFGLYCLGRVKTLPEGVEMVREVLKSGKVQQQFESYKDLSNQQNKLTEIVGHKVGEVQNMECRAWDAGDIKRPSFKRALLEPGISVIAEVKKASPSKGLIYQGDFDPVSIAKAYEENGARAISVLCDERYFQGSYDYLRAVSEAVSLPTLCKEFIIEECQIDKAAACGASAVLLIASVLDVERLEALLIYARNKGLDRLVEVHDEEELNRVLEQTSADIIGINNRNLKDFTVDIELTARLINELPKSKQREIVFVAESGITTSTDIQKLPRIVSGALVGEGVVNEPEKITELSRARPLVKICGITGAELCQDLGVDMVGLNFVESSKRHISVSEAIELRKTIGPKTKVVGIFQNHSIEDVKKITEKVDLDFIQLSGEEDLAFIDQCCRPVIKGIALVDEASIEKAKSFREKGAYILFDSVCPGSGTTGNWDLLNLSDFPYLLAGGLNLENLEAASKYGPLGFDSASGVETNGQKDPLKMKAFVEACDQYFNNQPL